MNYRHAFHAGNFADLAKHAVLLSVMAALRPRRVLDTHAGAGLYDLQGTDARRTNEAAVGVARLMAEAEPPGALAVLKHAVAKANPGGGLRWYPGSPRLAVDALAPGGAYVGFELEPQAHAALAHNLRPPRGVQAQAVLADGYVEAAGRLAKSIDGATLLLIDPPFERADEDRRMLELIARAARAPKTATLAWLPLKDMETFDAFLRRLEAQRPKSLVAAEVRLKPLDDPMQMNGCALVLVNGPDIDAQTAQVCGWIATHLGGPKGSARVERMAG